MGLGNILILTQVTVCVLSAIFALMWFISISVQLGDFQGHCLLEAKGEWDVQSGKDTLNITSWGLSANCNFPVFVGVVSFLVAMAYGSWMAVLLYLASEPSWLAAFLAAVAHCVIALVIFVSACVVSHGFDTWCSLLMQQSTSCAAEEYGTFLTDKTIDTSSYYFLFEIAKFGVWASWICWLVLVVCSIIQIYRFHKREDFLISISRERERLLQRVSAKQGYDPV